MAILSNERSASLDEIVTEMDRRGRVIEELEAKIEALSATPAPSQDAAVASSSNWRDDPSADERWNAGLDYAMTHLCKLLGVETGAVTWDAATETLDGDVMAVLGNIMRAKYGEDWGPQDSTRPAPLQDAAVEKLVDIAREHLEIDGDGEGPFIRFDSIENAVRAVLAATRPAEAQAVAEGWKPTELHIVFKDEGGPSNLRFIEVETIDGRSVRAGTWLKRDGYDILALSVHPSDVALAASPATGGA